MATLRMDAVPRRTSLVPLASPCFVLCLLGVETERAFRLPGEGGDHLHCMVELRPGNLRCRLLETTLVLTSDLYHNHRGVEPGMRHLLRIDALEGADCSDSQREPCGSGLEWQHGAWLLSW